MDASRTRTVTSEGYGDVTYRLVGVVDFGLVRDVLGSRVFSDLMRSHPARFFGSAITVALGPGHWDPFEVWVPVIDDNAPGLPIAVRLERVLAWQKLWSRVIM